MPPVLAGFSGQKSLARSYIRTSPEEYSDEDVLIKFSSIGLMSQLQPFMFTMEVHPGGLVKLTKDDDSAHFMVFCDPKLSVKYMGFSNWDVPVAYFYDCPMEVEDM